MRMKLYIALLLQVVINYNQLRLVSYLAYLLSSCCELCLAAEYPAGVLWKFEVAYCAFMIMSVT